ncbi:MAG: primosomal protein N' [Lachnospiraceae bacterium]|nr:primosomal protein N' [Lachnospiraceae bacterium]
MAAYADIIIDISAPTLDRSFQYEVPKELQDRAEIGAPVLVPFANAKAPRRGYIVGLSDELKVAPEKLKPIADIPEKDITIEDSMVALAYRIKRRYGGSLYDALRTVIPSRQKIASVPKRKIRRVMTADALTELLTETPRSQTAKARLYSALIETEEIPYELVTGKLKITKAALDRAEEAGILAVIEQDEADNEPGEGLTVTLNDEQVHAADTISAGFGTSGVYVLHGITGSGKTEVYLSVIEKTLATGKQVIVLIPEIALTYQTVLRFYRCFGDRVAFVHSKMPAGERYRIRERAKEGKISIMIGPRSALFTPFPNLGMIIVDEEHENSYRSELTPRYHAVDVAVERARMCGATVVLGSATPSLETFYHCEQGDYTLLTLSKRAKDGAMLPRSEIVDLREELKAKNFSVISRRLRTAIEERLEKHEQVMLFLNRRGYAGFVSCRSCGYIAQCPHCDISLTYHNDGTLRCHYCGHKVPYQKKCPECGSQYFLPFGKSGTQKIEELVEKEFPKARVLRMDADTTKAADDYEAILSEFAEGKGDILIGTQMIVKGHDFPNVTLVGALAADLSLGVADYACAERTFDLLAQAAGRAGRDKIPGEVIIQTYRPDHYAITAAAASDYRSFYDTEIRYRRSFGYPPVRHMLTIVGGHRRENTLEKAMDELAVKAREIAEQGGATVIGPATPQLQKKNDMYFRVIYVKCNDIESLIAVKDAAEAWMHAARGGVGLTFDMD